MSGLWVAGADGCKSQWCVVLRNVESGEMRTRLVPTFEGLLGLIEEPRLVAVDIPIGLPSYAVPGGRACEREARKLLGRRASCVFSAVGRSALEGLSRLEAHSLSRAAGGLGIGAQAWGLSAKLKEADAAMTPELQSRVREVHPEISFWAMNGGVAMPNKKSAEGARERRDALILQGFSRAFIEAVPAAVRAATDDVLDACAAAWSAGRMLTGDASRLPTALDLDARGLDQAIWF